ncbi:molybdopterin synthase catalytic subunit-like [Miscanthus floridulus]|uniref:molybdopterin synthase catalytic subunit-like n=1 Tax=Miscanthus floridulus TaxID=154761 RepID=UPI0034598D31
MVPGVPARSLTPLGGGGVPGPVAARLGAKADTPEARVSEERAVSPMGSTVEVERATVGPTPSSPRRVEEVPGFGGGQLAPVDLEATLLPPPAPLQRRLVVSKRLHPHSRPRGDNVRDLSAGAIATFEGTTRDHFAGRRVVELRYEAYAAMARRRLAAILWEARSRHVLRRLAVAHRLGPVPVGEASVFVAASATHRADAMEACRYVIDELKSSVPIWKKEVYDDGEVWKENREFLDRHSGDAHGHGNRHGSAGCCGGKVRVQEA